MSVPVRYSSFLNFYPRPPRGGRRGMRRGSPDLRNFYPRPPRGGRRRQPVQWPRRFSISIHALREEGDLPLGRNETARKISIHALREEGDASRLLRVSGTKKISIHALREEGDQRAKEYSRAAVEFLSTPSARRATRRDHADQRLRDISIHALREEGDDRQHPSVYPRGNFYPRPPRGGRQPGRRCNGQHIGDFYPRPPRGGRRTWFLPVSTPKVFLSTPSARRATRDQQRVALKLNISIHALREEGDFHGHSCK